MVTFYDNRYHATNCYVKVEVLYPSVDGVTNIFHKIAMEQQRPLQAMLSSHQTREIEFLQKNGFKKVRQCYELEVTSNRLSRNHFKNVSLTKENSQSVVYESCCQLLFEHYKATHEAINPLTADYEAFKQILPSNIFYEKTKDNLIRHVAFIDGNEIAYVCTQDMATFQDFAYSVVTELFQTHNTLIFEADDVDSVAMLLKELFSLTIEETFDTWLFTI